MFDLPRLDDYDCNELVVCSHVETADAELKKWLEDDQALISRVSGQFALVLTGGQSGNHFHVELATRSHISATRFGGKPPKRPPTKVAELRLACDRVHGHKVTYAARAMFRLSPGRFPEIMRTTLAETKSGGVSMRVIGASIEVTGAPIREIRWRMRDDEDANVTLSGYTNSSTVTDSFLVEIITALRGALDAIVA